MPSLDVSWVLDDPMFSDDIQIIRFTETVDNNGIGIRTEETIATTAVITSDRGDILARLSGMRNINGSITIHTRFTLTTGDNTHDADQIIWNGQKYTVSDVFDYSRYGDGFTSARCEPWGIAGEE